MPAELRPLQEALALSRTGRRQEAEQVYREVLGRDPQNADALHLLGQLYLDCGQTRAAAGLISKAIQQRPDVPFFYNTLGNAFRGLGKREQALLSFRKAISLRPDFAEALSNLGAALEESGRAAEAISFHREAAALQPGRAEIHGNLGNALRSAGRPEEAAAAYQTALRLDPGFAKGWMNLGNLYFDGEEYSQAEAHYREALRLNPRLAAAQTNLGSALSQLGRFTEAEKWCRKALERAPGDPLAQCNLASVLAMTGRAELAEPLCRQALGTKPGLPEAHTNLGMALVKLRRLDEAEQQYRTALQLRPNRPAAYANLARVSMLAGRFAESEECLRRAHEHWPGDSGVLGCYGDLCAAQLDFAGALGWYDKAGRVAPGDGLIRRSRAMVLLAVGDFERGWEEYEFRWNAGDCPPAEFPQPLWTGAPFPDRTLLLHTEQGLGDSLQFIRFAPLVKQLGGRVILACEPALLPILSGAEGVDLAVSKIGEIPAFDYHLALMSLPRVLRTREQTIPRKAPYLEVPPAAIARARRRVAEMCGGPDGRLRVGVAWAGSAKHANDANRSMRLEQIEPLLRIPGVQCLSLQQGVTLPPECPMVPVVTDSDDLAATAAIVLQLDLVIAVDTMIVHLAGALGRPVWTLLAFAPDWRWMTGREDSPWYPGMRLFRQPRFGDWDDVVQRVAGELSQRAAEPAVLR